MNIFPLRFDEMAPIEIREEIYFYRYQDPCSGSYNAEPIENRYRAYRETPEGYWIVPDYHYHTNEVNTRYKKWIKKQLEHNITPRKLFAYRSKQDALYSYYRKKLEHLRHLEAKHSQIKSIVRRIESQENFFGIQRPAITSLNEYIAIKKELEPLKKERPRKLFIEESEFVL